MISEPPWKEARVTAEKDIARKVDHVRSAVQTRSHGCHWPECKRQVPPAMWGCKEHWFQLPPALRGRIWASYRPSQEIDMHPSQAYLDAALDVQMWIQQRAARGGA